MSIDIYLYSEGKLPMTNSTTLYIMLISTSLFIMCGYTILANLGLIALYVVYLKEAFPVTTT